MKKTIALIVLAILMTSCSALQPQTAPELLPTDEPVANLPNPAAVFCEEHGYVSEIRTADDGSQSGVCIFPDGSECDEWQYFRGECGPAGDGGAIVPPVDLATPMPIDPADYEGWWTYVHDVYGFSFMLPEDWIVEEVTTFDPLMNGHTLTLRPEYLAPGVAGGGESIRMTFRRIGEDAMLWPTGVGQGEFRQQENLDVAGQPALRMVLVCPSGEVTAIWYHDSDGQMNIVRGDLEFGFIFSYGSHCEPGYSLGGKVQRVGDMIIASLVVP